MTPPLFEAAPRLLPRLVGERYKCACSCVELSTYPKYGP